MAQCPFCKSKVSENAKFCAGCGKSIPSPPSCPSCGVKLLPGKTFCHKCGTGAGSENSKKPRKKSMLRTFLFIFLAFFFVLLLTAGGILIAYRAGYLEDFVDNRRDDMAAFLGNYIDHPYLDKFLNSGEWHTVLGNPLQNSYMAGNGISLPVQKWSSSEIKVPAGFDEYILPGIAVVSDNKNFYVNLMSEEEDSKLLCYNRETGLEQWSYSFGKQGILSPPAFINGRIYICMLSREEEKSKLIALDPDTRRELWSKDLEERIALCGAVGDKGNIYVSTLEKSSGGALFCFDAETGFQKWSFIKEDAGFFFTPSLKDDKLYISTITDKAEDTSSGLYCLDCSSGQVLWSREFLGHIATYPAIVDGMIYIFSIDRLEAKKKVLFAINIETGLSLWEKEFEVDNYFDGLLIYQAKIVVSEKDNLIFFCAGKSYEKRIVAIDRLTGTVKWEWKDIVPGTKLFSFPLACNQNILMVWTAAGLLGLKPVNGEEFWCHPYEQDFPGHNITLVSPNICFNKNDICFLEFSKKEVNNTLKLTALTRVSKNQEEFAEVESRNNLDKAHNVMKEMTNETSLGELAACESNLKNIATALEMYATDNRGDYPLSLDYLTEPVAGGGSYMRSIPVCPSCGKDYIYKMELSPDNFLLMCGGENAHIETDTVDEGHFPIYSPGEGIALRGPVPEISGSNTVAVNNPAPTPAENNDEETLEKAKLLYEKGKYDEALEAMKSLSADGLSTVEAFILFGDIYRKEGQFDKALENYNYALGKDPSSELAFLGKGNVYFKKGDTKKAIEEYKKAPWQPSAHTNMGIIYAKEGKLDASIKEFKEAVNLDPDKDITHINLAGAYYRKKNWKEAINSYSKAIEKNSENPASYHGLGLSYKNNGEYDKALIYLKKFIELAPDDSKTEEVREIINKIK